MHNSICVITAYFGCFPKYFSLWLKTCGANPGIDFIVFSDATYEGQLPENVRIENMTLDRMKELASEKMHMTVSLEQPYKCCDFKPLYGTIFHDYISEYSYWGHCDIDLMFGDLSYFLKKYEYKKYDKFLPLGHLCLYRNTEEVNSYYTLLGSHNGDYKEVFSNPESFYFDELGGIFQIYLTNKLPMFTKRIFADITNKYRRYRLSELAYLDEPVRNYDYQVFYWENGKTYRAYIENGIVTYEEFMYVHFQKRPNYEIDFDVDLVNAFYITNQGFIPKEADVVTKNDIQRYNRFNGVIYEKAEILLWSLKEIKKKVLTRIWGNK